MPLEIERKVLEINKRALVAKILRLKPRPEKLLEGLVRVHYFDFPDRRIYKKKNLLRVREFIPRKKTAYTELVYKTYRGVKKGCKLFDECEMVFPGRAAEPQLRAFLACLGLKQTAYYEKRRTLFAYKNVKFEIDEHPGIPPFVEIEGPSSAVIESAIRLLGLQDLEQSAETISELLARKYGGRKLDGLVFGKK